MMSTDWARVRSGVTVESVRALYDFLDTRTDLAGFRADVMNALGEWNVAVHSYTGTRGLELIVYEDIPPDEVLISGDSGELVKFDDLIHRAQKIETRFNWLPDWHSQTGDRIRSAAAAQTAAVESDEERARISTASPVPDWTEMDG